MNVVALTSLWMSALGAAAKAVDAAARARALPASECGAERALLAAERSWLAALDWDRRDA